MTMYEIVEDLGRNRIEQRQVEKLAKEFLLKQEKLQKHLKDQFNELRTALKVQEQTCEAILKKNIQHIENGINRLRKVPQSLFEDVDFFRRSAKEKLDLFEQNEDPSFINYAMLEVKDVDGDPDIIFVGEHVVNELEKLKDISALRVEDQIQQLDLKFDNTLQKAISKAVECKRVDGVVIDENEIASLAELIKEAEVEEHKNQIHKPKNSVTMGAYTRESINMLTGDENDLLSDAPVFERSKPPLSQGDRSKRNQGAPTTGNSQMEDIDIEVALVQEIESYI